jgi:hypothetical protein
LQGVRLDSRRFQELLRLRVVLGLDPLVIVKSLLLGDVVVDLEAVAIQRVLLLCACDVAHRHGQGFGGPLVGFWPTAWRELQASL